MFFTPVGMGGGCAAYVFLLLSVQTLHDYSRGGCEWDCTCHTGGIPSQTEWRRLFPVEDATVYFYYNETRQLLCPDTGQVQGCSSSADVLL